MDGPHIAGRFSFLAHFSPSKGIILAGASINTSINGDLASGRRAAEAVICEVQEKKP